MALQALRRAAAAQIMQHQRGSNNNSKGTFRYLHQGLGAGPAAVTRSSAATSSTFGMVGAGEVRGPLWALATRMASTAREVGREADGGLLSVLRLELDHERKTYSQPKELTRGAPKPWTLTDKPGQAPVILRRSYGEEDIAVTCVYQSDGYGDDENPEEDINSEDEDMDASGLGSCVNMTITINKGADNPTLEISAASYGTQITIEHVYFWEDKDSKEAVYEGPNFLQLDEEVQTQFEKFIKARGVNKELTGYLFTILADKEQREYMRWLQKVDAFLKL
ncbi:unnamed protein product [Calypogeia fissa]